MNTQKLFVDKKCPIWNASRQPSNMLLLLLEQAAPVGGQSGGSFGSKKLRKQPISKNAQNPENRQNGFRYQIESELYYLQSRYYDPEVGRFLNADALITSDHGLLGNNMLAYCLNNPVNCVDDTGKDAIWIQESASAGTMGHSGLLVQDDEGNWWYFYWGPAEQDGLTIISGTPAVCILEPVDTSRTNLNNTKSIKLTFLLLKLDGEQSNDPYFANQWASISCTMYFYGDYSATYEFLRDLKEKADAGEVMYKLLEFNCCQVSCKAMGQSDERFNYVLPVAVVPNIAFFKIISNFMPRRKTIDISKVIVQ